ncbi:hypothetical protein GCM10011313_20640 [Mycetocola zhadangensis]|nr:hypothetical protein GCM10011313_20640 [Mycetocola zhadangensis]
MIVPSRFSMKNVAATSNASGLLSVADRVIVLFCTSGNRVPLTPGGSAGTLGLGA